MLISQNDHSGLVGAWQYPGCTVETYVVDGKTTSRTVGASWIGDPDKPCADTSVPVLAHDIRFEQLQSLIVNEGEVLLGCPAEANAGRGVTPVERLRGLGDGWDIRVTLMLNRFSWHAAVCTVLVHIDAYGPPEIMSQHRAFLREKGKRQAHLAARAYGEPNDVVQQTKLLLSELSLSQQLELLHLMSTPASPALYAGSVLDSGSSKCSLAF